MMKRERVAAAMAGEEVDRIPVSFWGHDYVREWSPESLAEATLERLHRHDWDFVKVNPRATYYAEAWGNRYKPSGDDAHGPLNVDYVLKAAADLERLMPVDVTEGSFGEQLAALRLIGKGLMGKTPFIQTVFSPLAVIGRLANGDLGFVRRLMREEPDALHHALDAIARTLVGYAKACVDAGADGIFFATVEWGTYDVATEEQYAEFGRKYDLPVLEAVTEAPFNVLHVCRKHNMLEALLDYPVRVLNWAADEKDNPSLAEILGKGNRAVMGGIAVQTVSQGTTEQVTSEALTAMEETGGRRFLLSASCSIPPQTPEENLMAAIAAAKSKPKKPAKRQ